VLRGVATAVTADNTFFSQLALEFIDSISCGPRRFSQSSRAMAADMDG